MLSYRSNSTTKSYPIRLTCTLTFFLILLNATSCIAVELLIGTGGKNTFSYYAGKTICQAVKSYDDNFSCRPVPTGSATDGLTNLQNDSVDLALVSSKTIYDAFNQIGRFKYINIEYDKLRLLMPIYKSPVSLIARRDANICCLNDLQGKRVNCGEINTQEHLIFKQLMGLKNWQETDFSMFQNLPASHSQDSLALKRGSVQAMIHVGMHPDASLQRLIEQDNNTLVPLLDDDIHGLIEERVGFSKCKIKAGTYPGISEDIITLAMETLLISSATTDSSIITVVLGALHNSRQQLRQAHSSLLQQHTTVSTLNEGYLHPHPSALLFFQSTRSLY